MASMSAIHIRLLEIFILHWVYRNLNKHIFSRNYAKTTIFCKTDHFPQIIAKINRLLEKTYINIHAKFQNDRCNLFWVIACQKIDNLRTHTHACTHAHTHTHAHTNAHTHAYTHTHTHTHARTHTRTHTRARTSIHFRETTFFSLQIIYEYRKWRN